MKSFADLDLIEPLLRAVAAENYERPTPIQRQAIPPLLDGRDVLGCAQTGTGKTAAFALPVLQHLAEDPPSRRGRAPIKALVLSPTRELADQIGASFAAYSRYLKHIKHTVIVGGVNEKPQIEALRRGFSVLVATPGRLLDLHGRGYVDLGDVEFFILDEVDRMLDMGFIHDIRRVLKALPDDRQNLLFSATMPEPIVDLASSFLDDPVRVEITPDAPTTDLVEQRVMFVEKRDKRRLLIHLLTDELNVEQAIVFTRTKHGANRLTKHLNKANVNAMAIHGNKSQNARRRALNGFRDGDVTVLVATDIAARGIDVAGVTHVFNFDLPNEPEVYVHRIGRTGRAGADGVAVSFCDDSEGGYLRDIERLTGEEIEVVEEHPYHFQEAVPAPDTRKPRGRKRSGGSSRRSSRSRRSGGSRRSGASRRSSRSRRSGASQREEQNTQRAEADEAAEAPPKRRRRRRRRRSRNKGQEAASATNASATNTAEGRGDNDARQAGSDDATAAASKPRRYRRRRRRSGIPGPPRDDSGSSSRREDDDGSRTTYRRRRRRR